MPSQTLLQAWRLFRRPQICIRYMNNSLPRPPKVNILAPEEIDPLLLKARYLYAHKPESFPEINAEVLEYLNIYPEVKTGWHILIAANRNNVPFILEIYEKYKTMDVKQKTPVMVRIFNTLVQNQETEKAYTIFKTEKLAPLHANELWKRTDDLAFANEIYDYIFSNRPVVYGKAVSCYIKCLARLSVSSARAFLLRRHLQGQKIMAEMYTPIIQSVGKTKDLRQLWELYNEICQTGIPLFYPKSYVLVAFGKIQPELLFSVLKGETVKTSRAERKFMDLMDEEFIAQDMYRKRIWRGVAYGFVDRKMYDLVEQVLQHQRQHFGTGEDEKIWSAYASEVAQSESLDRGLEILQKAKTHGTTEIGAVFEALARVAYKQNDRKWLIKMLLTMKEWNCKMTPFLTRIFDELGIPVHHLV